MDLATQQGEKISRFLEESEECRIWTLLYLRYEKGKLKFDNESNVSTGNLGQIVPIAGLGLFL